MTCDHTDTQTPEDNAPDLQNDPFLTMNIDWATRTIYVGDLEPGTAEHFVKLMFLLTTRGPGEPINILMMSNGGTWMGALAMHDAIRAAGCLVTCEVLGGCMSGAVIVAQACDRRFIHPNATVMVHNVSHGVEGRSADIETWALHGKNECKRMHKILAESTGKTARFWANKCAKADFVMDADMAHKLGLFDEVLREYE